MLELRSKLFPHEDDLVLLNAIAGWDDHKTDIIPLQKNGVFYLLKVSGILLYVSLLYVQGNNESQSEEKLGFLVPTALLFRCSVILLHKKGA